MPINTDNNNQIPSVHTELQSAYDDIFKSSLLSKFRFGRTAKKREKLLSLLKYIIFQTPQNKTNVPPEKKIRDMNVRLLNVEQAHSSLLKQVHYKRIVTKIETGDTKISEQELKEVTEQLIHSTQLGHLQDQSDNLKISITQKKMPNDKQLKDLVKTFCNIHLHKSFEEPDRAVQIQLKTLTLLNNQATRESSGQLNRYLNLIDKTRKALTDKFPNIKTDSLSVSKKGKSLRTRAFKKNDITTRENTKEPINTINYHELPDEDRENMSHSAFHKLARNTKNPELHDIRETGAAFGNIASAVGHSAKITLDNPNQSQYLTAAIIHKNSEQLTIASQGPRQSKNQKHNIAQFHKLIIDNKVDTVVNLLKSEDSKRASAAVTYWPDHVGESQVYTYKEPGDQNEKSSLQVQVKTMNIEHETTHNTITLELTHKDSTNNTKTHTVKVKHFPNWPDHGVPIDGFESFIANIRPYFQNKMIVHCNAGLGRTGTIISILTILDKIDKDQVTRQNLETEIQNHILNSRRKRGVQYVQNKEQYDFIHKLTSSYLARKEQNMNHTGTTNTHGTDSPPDLPPPRLPPMKRSNQTVDITRTNSPVIPKKLKTNDKQYSDNKTQSVINSPSSTPPQIKISEIPNLPPGSKKIDMKSEPTYNNENETDFEKAAPKLPPRNNLQDKNALANNNQNINDTKPIPAPRISKQPKTESIQHTTDQNIKNITDAKFQNEDAQNKTTSNLDNTVKTDARPVPRKRSVRKMESQVMTNHQEINRKRPDAPLKRHHSESDTDPRVNNQTEITTKPVPKPRKINEKKLSADISGNIQKKSPPPTILPKPKRPTSTINPPNIDKEQDETTAPPLPPRRNK